MSTDDLSQRTNHLKKIEKNVIENSNFCDDCLYNWCTKRGNVSYCTMKSKGLFECRSCMLKIMNAYDRELLLEEETKINPKEKVILTI